MDSNHGEHPQDAESDDEEEPPKPRRKSSGAPGIPPSKKKSSRNSPTLAGRGTDTGIIPAGKTLFFDLDYNIAAAVCYFPLLILAPVLWLATEKNADKYLKFHAVQSLVLGVSLVAFNVVCGTVTSILSVIPVIGPAISFVILVLQALIGFAFFGVCFKMAYSIFNGKDARLPVVANLADRIVESYF